MKNTRASTLPIILIVCLSIISGYLVNTLWTYIEKQTHPMEYSEAVDAASLEFGVPRPIIYATIKTESSFDPRAVSSAGAMGLMQMLPSTFEWLTGDEHLCENFTADRLYDAQISIRYGTYYLSYLYRKFDYNWETAFAAYNGGEGNVSKWLEGDEYSDGHGNLTDIPFSETAKYVKKINKAIDTYEKLYPEIKFIGVEQ